MSRSTASIRHLVWEQRLRSLPRIGIAILIVGGVLGAVALYSVGSVTERAGVVTQVLRESSEEGQIRSELLVKLDDGQTVKARVRSGSPPPKGARITLLETETALFGIRRYRFKP